MLHGYIDVPTFAYFEFKNIWSGSVFREFNYKIYPISNDDGKELKLIIWFGMKSIDSISEDDYQKVMHFDFSEDGYEKLKAAVNAEIDKYIVENNIDLNEDEEE